MHPSEWIRRLLAPLVARIRALAVRGVVLLSNDQTRAQTLQVAALAGETLDPVERFGEFGFRSRPPAGAEVLVVCIGGDRTHPIAVATEYREARPRGLAEGDVGLYSASAGAAVVLLTLRANGVLEITAPAGVTIAGNVAVTGNLTVAGDASATGNVSDAAGSMAEARGYYNAHTHTHGGSAGTTSPPTPPMT